MRQRFEAESVRVSLASWLLQQIADEEAVAHEAARQAFYDATEGQPQVNYEVWPFGKIAVSRNTYTDLATCVLSPARVLAECAAKRAIVEHSLCRPTSLIRNEYRTFTFLPSDGKPGIVEQWARDEEGGLLQIVREWRDEDYWNTVLEMVESPILRLLAAPYADEPGYRAEWAVSP